MTLEEVAAAIKIRSEYLNAIEKGDYIRLPSPAYAQGFVMNYAIYLGFPKKETSALFRREFDSQKAYRVLPKALTPESELNHRTFRLRRTSIGIFFIFIFLIAYLVFQYRSIFFSPPLSISLPKQGASVQQNFEVKGSTDPSAVVSVNGEIVSVDQNGNFIKELSLLPGKSDIQVAAKNRYGKTSTIDRMVNVKQ